MPRDLAVRRRRLEHLEAAKVACADLATPLRDIVLPAEIGAGAKLPILDLAELANVEPEPKSFIIPRLAPAGEVTLFTGAGAVGKSLLAQQLATALAAGVPTLGLNLAPAPAIYITCEDDADQLHWRQAHICRALGVDMAALAGSLHLASLRGQPDNALTMIDQDGRLAPAPLYSRLSSLLRSTGARLACLDNVAHLFTGDENSRGEVTRFVNLLNRLAGETGAAIVLLGHPNKSGDSYSGSTAWLNAVRSQIFMARAEDDDGDPDLRTLSIGKPNYTAAGEVLRFRWHEWAFVSENGLFAEWRGAGEYARETEDEQLFLTCLAERARQQRAVSERRSSTYAPTVFAKMPEAKGLSAKRLESAMDRLFRRSVIERAELWKGPDRKPVFGLRRVAGDGAGNGAGNTADDARETVL